jgi:hypothetical protein
MVVMPGALSTTAAESMALVNPHSENAMKVFIGGSRAVSKLNATIRAQIDDVVINRGHTVPIGDANGADKAVQQYLSDRQYPHVVVFCMEEECRNNLGAWPTRNVEPPLNAKGFTYYAARDRLMSQEAKCAVMLWDGKSKGTLNNILNMVGEGKRTLVYFAPTLRRRRISTLWRTQVIYRRC